MAIPVAYNLRNLRERKTHTLMTALGLALTVAVLLSVLALVGGLRETFRASGGSLNILALRKGATTELASNFNRSVYNDLKFKPGIARNQSGEPMASLELVTVISLESPEHPTGTNVNFRGVPAVGIQLRNGLSIERGRWFRPGFREVAVGHSIAMRYPEVGVGGKLHLGHGDWEVVGIMRAGDSSINSEIYCDLNQLAADETRPEVLSSVLLRASDPVAKAALIRDLTDDQRLNVDALAETDYYDRQSRSSAPVQFVGLFVAALMSIGSVSGLHLHLDGVSCVVPKRKASPKFPTLGIGQTFSVLPRDVLFSQPAQALIVTWRPSMFGSSVHWIASSPRGTSTLTFADTSPHWSGVSSRLVAPP